MSALYGLASPGKDSSPFLRLRRREKGCLDRGSAEPGPMSEQGEGPGDTFALLTGGSRPDGSLRPVGRRYTRRGRVRALVAPPPELSGSAPDPHPSHRV